VSKDLLPEGFGELEQFAAVWALATERARSEKRVRSSMAELKAFYEAVLPRMDAIIAHLDRFELEKMLPPESCLLMLALSFMEIAPAVELIGSPDEPGVFEADRFVIEEV
jgi:hypothetical protein